MTALISPYLFTTALLRSTFIVPSFISSQADLVVHRLIFPMSILVANAIIFYS